LKSMPKRAAVDLAPRRIGALAVLPAVRNLGTLHALLPAETIEIAMIFTDYTRISRCAAPRHKRVAFDRLSYWGTDDV
jgi:hypothetical protein